MTSLYVTGSPTALLPRSSAVRGAKGGASPRGAPSPLLLFGAALLLLHQEAPGLGSLEALRFLDDHFDRVLAEGQVLVRRVGQQAAGLQGEGGNPPSVDVQPYVVLLDLHPRVRVLDERLYDRRPVLGTWGGPPRGDRGFDLVPDDLAVHVVQPLAELVVDPGYVLLALSAVEAGVVLAVPGQDGVVAGAAGVLVLPGVL